MAYQKLHTLNYVFFSKRIFFSGISNEDNENDEEKENRATDDSIINTTNLIDKEREANKDSPKGGEEKKGKDGSLSKLKVFIVNVASKLN